MTSRSFLATLALASSSRLRAPKTRTSYPLPLTAAAPSSALNEKLQSTTRSKRQPRPRRASSAHLSHSTTRTRHRDNTADHRSSPFRQQQPDSESSQTSPSSSSSSREKRPLLQPYELSRRLIALCERGDVDLAVTALQRAPRNAQNIKVWNTIIQQCMSAKKYKLGHRVYTDMKRRGFVPNVRTYATMMTGYATIDNWRPLTMHLGLVHNLYVQFRQHLKRTRNSIDNPASESSASFILYPTALYISILGKAGKYQKAFDVFHALDTGGPVAPDPKIYSCLLSVLAERVGATDASAEAIEQSVSEAKYVWRRHMRTSDRQPQHDVEPRSIEAMIKVLSRGKTPDHELMFDILRDFCGLPSPSDGHRRPSPPSQRKKVGLTTWILNEILDGCIAAGRPEMTVHYAQSVMDNAVLRPILSAWHLHKLLRAHILLAKDSASPSHTENVAAWVEWMVAQYPVRESKEIIPNGNTIVSALGLCYHCGDMHSALRIARAMIFDDSQESPPSRVDGASATGSLSLPFRVKAWEYLFRLASTAGTSQDDKRHCFELLKSHGSTVVLDVWDSTSAAIERLAMTEKRTHISLALLIVQMLETDLPSSDHEGAAEKLDDVTGLEAWSDIRKRAESFLEKTRRRKS